jgi:hypothetical protein
MTSRFVFLSLAIALAQTAAVVAAGMDESALRAPLTAPPGAPHATQNTDGNPESYWTPERMQQAKPFPLPKVSEDRKSKAPRTDERESVLSAPGSPPIPPKQ